MRVDGVLFDGRSSAKRRVTYELAGTELIVRDSGGEQRCPLAAVQLAPRVGGVRCSFTLPGGMRGELADEAFIAELQRRRGRTGSDRLHRFERHLGWVLLSLLLTAGVIWAGIRFGIPPLARTVAFAVPPAVEEQLGRETLTILDRLVFSPTKLPAE